MGLYDERFYNIIASSSINSAEVVSSYISGLLRPSSVIDIGCGEGHWAAAFERLGCRVLGVDGDYVKEPIVPFVAHDLSKSIPVNLGEFDLAISLEVAEHLPAKRADGFVSDLCSLAPAVLFSAAIPFQTGAGHVNCQWQSYWASRFESNGYSVNLGVRWPFWEDDRVECWYKQNIFLAHRPDLFSDLPESVGPMDVVHPEIHYWGRS